YPTQTPWSLSCAMDYGGSTSGVRSSSVESTTQRTGTTAKNDEAQTSLSVDEIPSQRLESLLRRSAARLSSYVGLERHGVLGSSANHLPSTTFFTCPFRPR